VTALLAAQAPASFQAVNRVYEYRLRPTRAQAVAFDETCRLLRSLYNAALQERRDAYAKQRISVTKRMQDAQLKAIRTEHPEYAALHFHLLQDVIVRLDRAFQLGLGRSLRETRCHAA